MAYREKSNENTQQTITKCPPMYILSHRRDPVISRLRKNIHDTSQKDFCTQCHSGPIKNFVECKIFNF